jgi:ubiquilin
MITPEMRQQMQSPQFRQMMANPQMIQQMMSMAGGMGGMGAGMNPLANMFGQQPGAGIPGMGGMGAGMNPLANMYGNQAPAQPAGPVVPPEELYATQLAQLNDMGFYSPQENIRALQMTGGNVEGAVEWLFSHPAGTM